MRNLPGWEHLVAILPFLRPMWRSMKMLLGKCLESSLVGCMSSSGGISVAVVMACCADVSLRVSVSSSLISDKATDLGGNSSSTISMAMENVSTSFLVTMAVIVTPVMSCRSPKQPRRNQWILPHGPFEFWHVRSHWVHHCTIVIWGTGQCTMMSMFMALGQQAFSEKQRCAEMCAIMHAAFGKRVLSISYQGSPKRNSMLPWHISRCVQEFLGTPARWNSKSALTH